jgi:hypothetical protein
VKRVWLSIAVILVAGGVLFAEKHRAQPVQNHLPPVILQDPAQVPYLTGGNIFSGKIDLWGNPWAKTENVRPAYSSFPQKEFKPVNLENFQPKLDVKNESVVTVQDREVAYALFEVGGFTLTVNLKPGYANPQALMPTRLNAGIGGSFSF